MRMGVVDKIFDNFEILYDGYTDMPKPRAVRAELFGYLEEKGVDMPEAENYVTSLASEYEKQGFLYGFRYACALFFDGTLLT